MPTHVAVHPTCDRIYVTDGYSNSHVHIFQKSDGAYLKSFGESGTGAGQFFLPHDVCLWDETTLLVADRENHRIQIFDSGLCIDLAECLRGSMPENGPCLCASYSRFRREHW